MHLKNNTVESNFSIAKLFVKYFSSVYTPYKTKTSVSKEENYSFCNCKFTTHNIVDALFKIVNDSMPRPDLISALFIKKYHCTLINSIYWLFNLFLSTSNFSENWESSYISRIWKSGDRSSTQGYLPNTKLCDLPKLFKKLFELYLSCYFKIAMLLLVVVR